MLLEINHSFKQMQQKQLIAGEIPGAWGLLCRNGGSLWKHHRLGDLGLGLSPAESKPPRQARMLRKKVGLQISIHHNISDFYFSQREGVSEERSRDDRAAGSL